MDTGYYTVLVGANPFGIGANGLGTYTLCIEGSGSVRAVDRPERRIVVSVAHVDMSDGEPAQFGINLGSRPTGPVEILMTKLEPASDSQYVVEPLVHSFTVDNWDVPQVVTVRRKADYVTPKADGFSLHYWGKGGGYDKEFEFLDLSDRVPGWMTLRSTHDREPTLADQVAEAQKQNSPATGGPGILGVARAGETLTATTSGIRDEDGLDNAVFAYQWVRSELGAESGTDIAGATGSTYVAASEDEGKVITVRVTFTDDAGNPESVISYGVLAPPTPREDTGNRETADPPAKTDEPDGKTPDTPAKGTPAVGEPPPAAEPPAVGEPPPAAEPFTAQIVDVPLSHNGRDAIVFELRLSEAPRRGFSYKTLRAHALEVTGGSVATARRLERPGNIRWEIRITPHSDGAVTVVLPPTGDCADDGAICTQDGRMLTGRLELTVAGPG